MSLHLIEEFLDELNDLVQECVDLLEKKDIQTAYIGVKENMNQIKDKADEILHLI